MTDVHKSGIRYIPPQKIKNFQKYIQVCLKSIISALEAGKNERRRLIHLKLKHLILLILSDILLFFAGSLLIESSGF